MSESQAATPQTKELKPSIDKAMPYPVDSVRSLVQRNEAAFALGRFDKSEKGTETGEISVLADAENLTKFLEVELGLNRDSKELITLAKFLKEKGADEVFQVITDRELTGKTQEQQVEFMASGVESLREMVNQLMEVRKQFKNSEEMEAEINALWEAYVNSKDSDKKAIRALIKETNKAKKETWASLKQLHRSQADLDKANKFRATADLGLSSTDPDKYKFKFWSSMAGGPVRKMLALADDALFHGAIGRRFHEFVAPDSAREAKMSDISVELRAKIVGSGDTTAVLEMWRAGVLSTAELGDLRKQLMVEAGKDSKSNPLNEEEEKALKDGSELPQFIKKGVFVKADRRVQAEHFQKYFQKQQDLSLEHYQNAQERYLGFSFENAKNWDKALYAAGVDVDIVLPEWFKNKAYPMVDRMGSGFLTFAEDLGTEIGFAVNNMEGTIAESAVNDLGSAVVAKEMAVENLNSILKNPKKFGEKEVVKAATILRGAESSFMRAAMMVARANDTISITEGKGLALSAVLSPLELASAGIDSVTGGIMFRENAGKLLKELKARAQKMLDGKGVLVEVNEGLKKMDNGDVAALGESSFALEEQWMNAQIKGSKIPQQYMEKESMDRHLNRSVFSRTAELIRKFLGPDTKLAQNSRVWRMLTEGSKRQSVDEVIGTTDQRRKESTLAVEYLKGQLATMKGGVERSNLAVQEATALLLQDAQRGFAKMELRQIFERSKLDKLWETIFALETAAAGVAVALAASTGLDAVSSGWVKLAETSLGKASTELQKMLEGLPKIIETAKEYGLPRAQAGAEKDIQYQQYEVWFKQANLWLAESSQENMPKIKDVLQKVLVSIPFLVATRASWNFMPGNRSFNTFNKAETIEDVNVV